MIEHEPNHNGKIYTQARAVEEFCGYTHAGALYVLRHRPDVLANGIRRAAREGVEGIENYLREAR